MRAFIVLLSSLAAIALSVVIKQEMHKRSSLRQQLQNANAFQEYLTQKKTFSSEAIIGSEPFLDYYEEGYVGGITLGTPPQTLTVVLDTGSKDLWVIDAACKDNTCTGKGSTYLKKQFDPTKSSTFNKTGKTYTLSYGKGSCKGYEGTDVINIGGLTYAQQGFGVSTSVADVFGKQQMDGILGLAWPDLAGFKDVTPVMQNLLPQLDEPLFTVWLDRHVVPSFGKVGGLITYGATDAVNCDADINYVTLSSKTYWQFAVNNFAVPGYSTSKTQQAISDTGTSFIGAPQAAFNAIVAASGAAYSKSAGQYVLPCKGNSPDLVFTIGSIDYAVPYAEYVIDLGLFPGNCALAVYSESSGGGFAPDWILGDTFIRTFCQVYDIGNARIGFAKAHHSEI